ncbi:hypothetical protein Tco_1389747 [Tanacetum coccineum]
MRLPCSPLLLTALQTLILHVAHHIASNLGDGESLPSGPSAYDQSLEALLTQPAASESEDRSHVHIHDHDGSEAPDESPDSILSSEPKPLEKHRPPPPPSILSPGESSYPP